ncbi:SGNH/GDSL hydrolase family protein [Aquabacterium sp. A7-Y]|uniref:SGNH/GDSL hydrolase family protein n=1 Tax=Aquabacterium sp. A7-Y TaxID=1349605 RepID=UPI00223CE30B|nr:SGNH/GDSL hydrolase family protein [Aquabacterium sp. A7-Y]MCW7536586.1 SGNH/GDSL hydrolase family protein [Aquabacterium sp. A7-Y]
MPLLTRLACLAVGAGLCYLLAARAGAQEATPEAALTRSVSPLGSALASPWDESFAAFERADRDRPPPPGGVVFVGSSSIRLWGGLEQQFELPPVVLKRGFGGSTMRDCAEHVQRLVMPYKPRLVVVYAGDNDLAQGRTPEQVLASFEAFVAAVRRELPETRIAYVSIKPSPSRSRLLEQARRTNALIELYSRRAEAVDYIDVFSAMLGPDGQPRPELFAADALHLNEAGYSLWKTVIGAHLH